MSLCADENVIWIGGDMDGLKDFEVGFLNAGGTLIQTMPVAAENVTTATCRAGEIAREIDAVDFYITSKPEYLQRAARSRLTVC
jgi:hypothetical protein